MPDSLKIAVVQATLCWQDPEENRRHLKSLLAGMDAQTDLVVLPETFTTGFLGELPGEPEPAEGPTLEWMQTLASDTGVAIAGSAALQSDGQLFNRMLLVAPGGEHYHYDKRHLFAFAGEADRYTSGSTREVWNYGGWRICPQICYDLRFPVWCRNRGDYDLLIFVANWPAPRLDAWTTLLRARAIENQAYVIGVNRVGEDGNGHVYPGSSAIYDPLGRPVVEAGSSETVAYGTISLESLHSLRDQFPFQIEADSFKLNN